MTKFNFGLMITLLKFLVILFFILLGYDTFNLVYPSKKTDTDQIVLEDVCLKKEDSYFGAGDINELYSTLENSTIYILVVNLLLSVLTVYFFRKWRTNQENTLAEIASNLKILKSTTSSKSDFENVNKSPATGEGLRTYYLTTSDIDLKRKNNENQVTEVIIKDCGEAINGNVEVRNSVVPEPMLKKNFLASLPSKELQAYRKDSNGRLTLQFESLNGEKAAFYQGRLPYIVVMPSDELQKNKELCECDITKFEKRLDNLESGLRTTEKVTLLWRSRMERTEEEILELQNQIHCMILDWEVIKNTAKLQNCGDGLSHKSSCASLYDAYKPLRMISEIIEESKKQVEQEGLKSCSMGDAKKLERKPLSREELKRMDVEDEKQRIELLRFESADLFAFEDQDEVEDTRKMIENLPVTCCTSDEIDVNSKHKADGPSNETVHKNEEIKKALLITNEKLKSDSIKLVKTIENVLKIEAPKEQSPHQESPVPPEMEKHCKNFQLHVPSHIVEPKRMHIPKRRPAPRCAYSII